MQLQLVHERLAARPEPDADLVAWADADGAQAARLQVVLESLKRELEGAHLVLEDLVEEFVRCEAQRDRVLGPLRVQLARLKATLARLIPERSGNEEDLETATAAAEDAHAEESEFAERDRGRREREQDEARTRATTRDPSSTTPGSSRS